MKKIYTCNENLFGTDTECSLYIAGFIAADGCLHDDKKRDLSIRLSTKDRQHLEKINTILQSNRPIKDYKNEYSGVSVLRINSQIIYNDLNRFNIVPRKSLIYTFPEWLITHPLVHHFMRGYFDGDGCFYIQKQTKEKVCFSVRGTTEFLKNYRNILELACGFQHRMYDIPTPNNCGQLNYGGNKNIIKVLEFLYKDAALFLERKKNIALKSYQLMDINNVNT